MKSQHQPCPIRPEIPPALRVRIARAAADVGRGPRDYMLQILERHVPGHFLADAEAPPSAADPVPGTTDEAESEGRNRRCTFDPRDLDAASRPESNEDWIANMKGVS